MKIESFISKLRISRDLTQEFIAAELGISRPTYIQIEKGNRDINITEARRIAKIYNISIEDLLDCREVKPKVKLPESKADQKKEIDIRVNRKDLEKFKQVILYLLEKVGSKPNIGETVLHKLLYFIDFDYYEKFEENLMGATYIKNHHGPTSVEFASIVENMEQNRELEAVKSKYFKFDQKKYLPLKKADLSLLSAQEIEHIDDVIARLSDKNAREIEKYSHQDIPWMTAKDGEPLSYESVFYRDEKYSVRSYEDEI
jgi:transcriptional regulator with XRE-family HTH domain